MAKRRAALLFLGSFPSRYDGQPVDAYLSEHANDKTGRVVGLIVMPGGMRNVFDVFKSPAQASGCGDCPKRGKASGGDQTCYVVNGSNIARGVGGLLKGRGVLPVATDAQIAKLVRGATVRTAVFGDAAALPVDVWARLSAIFAAHAYQVLGYTHGHTGRGLAFVDHLRETHQISCETAAEVTHAAALGFGTFRARKIGDKLTASERICPSDTLITSARMRGARGTSCGDCGGCNGKSARNYAIYDHSVGHSGQMVRAYAVGALSLSTAMLRA